MRSETATVIIITAEDIAEEEILEIVPEEDLIVVVMDAQTIQTS